MHKSSELEQYFAQRYDFSTLQQRTFKDADLELGHSHRRVRATEEDRQNYHGLDYLHYGQQEPKLRTKT